MSLTHLPNIITASRIALVPVLILALRDQRYDWALAIFAYAGLSDGLDGFLAKRFNLASRLGAMLDPAADKILLVSAYVMLTLLDQIPFWLTLTVVFRDLLIVGGYLVYTSLYGPVAMQPSLASKFNTLAQLALITVILGDLALKLTLGGVVSILVYLVFATTVASGVHYFWSWLIQRAVEPARPRGAHRER